VQLADCLGPLAYSVTDGFPVPRFARALPEPMEEIQMPLHILARRVLLDYCASRERARMGARMNFGRLV